MYDLEGLPALLSNNFANGKELTVRAKGPSGEKKFTAMRAHRHAARGAVLPARRHPAIRAAAAAGGEVVAEGDVL